MKTYSEQLTDAIEEFANFRTSLTEELDSQRIGMLALKLATVAKLAAYVTNDMPNSNANRQRDMNRCMALEETAAKLLTATSRLLIESEGIDLRYNDAFEKRAIALMSLADTTLSQVQQIVRKHV